MLVTLCMCTTAAWVCAHVARPVVSTGVCVCVTLTAGPSTSELLSHAGCFRQRRAEAVAPQRFTARLMVAAAAALEPVRSLQSRPAAAAAAPCWLPRAAREIYDSQ